MFRLELRIKFVLVKNRRKLELWFALSRDYYAITNIIICKLILKLYEKGIKNLNNTIHNKICIGVFRV